MPATRLDAHGELQQRRLSILLRMSHLSLMKHILSGRDTQRHWVGQWTSTEDKSLRVRRRGSESPGLRLGVG